ncbi:MAG: hypothetical protein B7Z11_04260, partial [Acidovorax sp. 32-64-7]
MPAFETLLTFFGVSVLLGLTPGPVRDLDFAVLGRPALELAREVGNARAFQRFVKREVMPTALDAADMDKFIRDGVSTIWHQSCTA